jgi:DNA repair protein RadA/Sms
VSLAGELRRVSRLDARLREARRLGFTRAGVPRVQADDGRDVDLDVVPLGTVREAIEALLGEKVTPPAREDAEAPAGAAQREPAGASVTAPAGAARGPARPAVRR